MEQIETTTSAEKQKFQENIRSLESHISELRPLATENIRLTEENGKLYGQIAARETLSRNDMERANKNEKRLQEIPKLENKLNDCMSREKAQLEAYNKQYTDLANVRASQLTGANQQIDDLRARNDQLSKSTQQLNESVMQLQNNLTISERDKKQSFAEVEALTVANQTLQDEKNALEQQNRELVASNNRLSELVQRLEHTVNALEQNNRVLLPRVLELEAQNAAQTPSTTSNNDQSKKRKTA